MKDIAAGYAYSDLLISKTAAFEQGATYRIQVRSGVGPNATLYATLKSVTGVQPGISYVDDKTLRLRMTAAQTAPMVKSVFLDVVREDTNPDEYLGIPQTIKVVVPVTAPEAEVGTGTNPLITSPSPSGSYPEGQAIGGILVADRTVTWAKSGVDAYAVTLNPTTGVWTLEETDFITKKSYAFTFTATDLAGRTAQQTVAIAITDVVETPTPTLTLTGPLTYAADAAAGVTVANIGNVPAGVTPTLTPNDGRLAIAGSQAAGWRVVKGLSASTAGTIALTVAAVGANSASASVVVTAASVGTPASTVLPPTINNASGNTVSSPQIGMLRGPNSNLFYQTKVIPGGSQQVDLRQHSDGTLVDNWVDRAGVDYDDHNTPVGAPYANGDFTSAAAGHNDDSLIYITNRRADGTKTTQVITVTFGTTTYPCLWLDRDEVLWLFIREGSDSWTFRTRDTFDGQWSPPTRFLTFDGRRIYGRQIRPDHANHVFNMWLSPDADESQNGAMVPFQIDCATRLGRDASGVRTLPVNFSTVPAILPATATHRYSAVDMSNDGKSVLVLKYANANVNDTELYFWRLTGADRWKINDWTQGNAILNQGLRLSAQSTYQPGSCLDRASPQTTAGGFRFFASRAQPMPVVGTAPQDAIWFMDRYDSADGVNWTQRVIDSSLQPLCRPLTLEGAVASSPVNYCQFVNFRDFASFDYAASKWAYRDKLVQPAAYYDSFSEASEVELTAHTSESGHTYETLTPYSTGLFLVNPAGRLTTASKQTAAAMNYQLPTSFRAGIYIRQVASGRVAVGMELRSDLADGTNKYVWRAYNNGDKYGLFVGNTNVFEGSVSGTRNVYIEIEVRRQPNGSDLNTLYANGFKIGEYTAPSPPTGARAALRMLADVIGQVGRNHDMVAIWPLAANDAGVTLPPTGTPANDVSGSVNSITINSVSPAQTVAAQGGTNSITITGA